MCEIHNFCNIFSHYWKVLKYFGVKLWHNLPITLRMWYEHTNAHVYSVTCEVFAWCVWRSVSLPEASLMSAMKPKELLSEAHVLGFGEGKKRSSWDTQTCRRFGKLCWTCGGFWYKPARLHVPLKYDERQIVSASWGHNKWMLLKTHFVLFFHPQ